MNFVYKEHIARLQICKKPGQIGGFIQYGAAAHLKSRPELIGNNIGECGLSQTWRTMK